MENGSSLSLWVGTLLGRGFLWKENWIFLSREKHCVSLLIIFNIYIFSKYLSLTAQE
jgi:hypothetical protein